MMRIRFLNPAASEGRSLRWWVSLAIFAVLVRGGLLLVESDHMRADPDAYRSIAETLAETGVFGTTAASGDPVATAFRPPLYPWLLSWMVSSAGQLSLTAVGLLHLVLGVGTVLLTWDIARRFLSNGAAWLAGVLVVIDPLLLSQSTLVMTETIATFLAMLVWWWWVVAVISPQPVWRGDWRLGPVLNTVILAVLLAVTYLCRPTFLVWAVLIGGLIAVAGPACRIRRAALVMTYGVVLAAAVGFWTMRNLAAVGEPVWATTHGGYTLLLANNESFYRYLRSGRNAARGLSEDGATDRLGWTRSPWDPEDFFARYARRHQVPPGSLNTQAYWTSDSWAPSDQGQTETGPANTGPASAGASASGRHWTEPEEDRVAYEAAVATIARHPEQFVWSCLARVIRLWHPVPHLTPERSPVMVAAVGIYHGLIGLLVVFAGAVWVRWRYRDKSSGGIGRWRPHARWWPAIALVVTLSAVHAVYWSNPRMRAPAIPMLAVVAVAGLSPRRRGYGSSPSNSFDPTRTCVAPSAIAST